MVEEIEIGNHQVDKLRTVHPLLILGHRMTLFVVEGLELVEVLLVALLQLPPVLNHVYVFKAGVIGIDIVFVAALTDVEHPFVHPVDIDDGRSPRLPVNVNVTGHRSLDDGITHIEVVEVVAGIAEQQRLEVCQSRFLVRKELIIETVGAKALVGIDGHRLQLGTPCGPTCDSRLTELVEVTVGIWREKELNVHGPAPVIPLVALIVGIDADLGIIEIAVVDSDGNDWQRHIPPMTDIRLYAAHRRQPTLTKELGTDDGRLPDGERSGVLFTGGGGFLTIGGVADLRTFRTSLWQTECQREIQRSCHHTTSFAENGFTKDMVSRADLPTVNIVRRGCELVAPFAATILLTAKGDIWSRHLLQRLGKAVNDLFTLEEINRTAFTRLQTERGMEACLLLVAIDENVAFGLNGHRG